VTFRRVVLLVTVMIVTSSVPATSGAADDVTVQVLTLVGKARGRTDPELRRHRSRLRRLAGFRAYRLVSDQQVGCRWRADQSFRLPNDRWLNLRPKRLADGQILMRVRIRDGNEALVDTDVRMNDRGTLVFGMPRDSLMGDGALLIMLNAGYPPEVRR
jgi:hypothetical protein